MRTWTFPLPDLTRRFAAIGLALGLSAGGLVAQTPRPLGGRPQSRPPSLDQSRRTAIVDAAQRVGPSVVSITAITHQAERPRSPFDLFFAPPQSGTVQSTGTGFA